MSYRSLQLQEDNSKQHEEIYNESNQNENVNAANFYNVRGIVQVVAPAHDQENLHHQLKKDSSNAQSQRDVECLRFRCWILQRINKFLQIHSSERQQGEIYESEFKNPNTMQNIDKR